jgi:hypothetical protein
VDKRGRGRGHRGWGWGLGSGGLTTDSDSDGRAYIVTRHTSHPTRRLVSRISEKGSRTFGSGSALIKYR